MCKINGFNNYSITREGLVISHKYRQGYFSAFLSPHLDKDGYELCSLTKRGQSKTFKIHRLVAGAFIPNPYNKPQVNHKNGIKNDNRSENLEWCTHKENMQHAKNNGLTGGAYGDKSPRTKLTWEDVEVMREMRCNGASFNLLKNMFGISSGSAKKIIYYERWNTQS